MYHLFLHGVSWEQTKSSSESASISRYGVLKPPLNYVVPLLPQCKMTVVIFKFVFCFFLVISLRIIIFSVWVKRLRFVDSGLVGARCTGDTFFTRNGRSRVL